MTINAVVVAVFILVVVYIVYRFCACSYATGGLDKYKHNQDKHQDKQKHNQDKQKDLIANPASRFETVDRNTIERIVGKKFPTVYPTWLRVNGKQLELDGYNAELSLAFEAQGPQHTAFSSKKDPRYKKYLDRVQNDKMKIALADKHNIGLIIIDYKVPKYILGSYIKSRIYDIAEIFRQRGLHDKLLALGHLAYKPGDYVEVIKNEPIFTGYNPDEAS